MADKTWIATDLELGKLDMYRDGDVIRIGRRYRFLDSEGQVLSEIVTGRLAIEMPISEIPADILAALQMINDWTKQRALEQEGMNE